MLVITSLTRPKAATKKDLQQSCAHGARMLQSKTLARQTRRNPTWHIGIDLHRRTVVVAAVHDSGEVSEAKTFGCQQTDRMVEHVRRFKPFRVVIEATSTYPWLDDRMARSSS